jgi:hypothetical protein
MARALIRILALALLLAVFPLAQIPAFAGRKVPAKSSAKVKAKAKTCAVTYASLLRAPKAGDILEIGEAVKLKLKGVKEPLDTYFVGKMQNQTHGGEGTEQLVFLEAKTNRLFKVEPNFIDGMDGDEGIKISSAARLVHGVQQQDGTCGAHAITNCVVQLGDILPFSPERKEIFNYAKSLVYGEGDWLQASTKVLDEKNISYEILSTSEAGANEKLLKHLGENKPAYLAYGVAPPSGDLEQKITTVFPFRPGMAGQSTDTHQIGWIPGDGSGHTNPHAVMLVKKISTKEGTKIIVLDSNQTDLRVWDASWLRRGQGHTVILTGTSGPDQVAELARLSALAKEVPQETYLQSLIGATTDGWVALTQQEFEVQKDFLEKAGAPAIFQQAMSASGNGPRFRLFAGKLSKTEVAGPVIDRPGTHSLTLEGQEIYRVYVRKADLAGSK